MCISTLFESTMGILTLFVVIRFIANQLFAGFVQKCGTPRIFNVLDKSFSVLHTLCLCGFQCGWPIFGQIHLGVGSKRNAVQYLASLGFSHTSLNFRRWDFPVLSFWGKFQNNSPTILSGIILE